MTVTTKSRIQTSPKTDADDLNFQPFKSFRNKDLVNRLEFKENVTIQFVYYLIVNR